MLMLVTGFSSLCVFLGLLFYRKYRQHLQALAFAPARYARVGDYNGRPLPMICEYLSEQGRRLIVKVDVVEIYHYGRDYFLKGYAGPDRRSQVLKLNRITRITLQWNGHCLRSPDELIWELGKQGGYAVAA